MMSWTVSSEREEVTDLSQICHIDDRSLSFEGGGGTVVWVVTSVFLQDCNPTAPPQKILKKFSVK